MPASLLPKGMLVPTATARLPGGWHGPVENASQPGAWASFMLLGAKPSGAPLAHAMAPSLPQHIQSIQVIPSLAQASLAKSPWTTWGPGETLMESQPREPSLLGVRGHGGSASKERSNFEGIELRAQGKATAGCWECKAEAQEACCLKWQSLSADSQPAAQSSTCPGGREFGEDSWRGGRCPVNLRLCSVTHSALHQAALQWRPLPWLPPGHGCLHLQALPMLTSVNSLSPPPARFIKPVLV